MGAGDTEAPPPRKPNAAKRLLAVLGPGFITGASDDDPSGIATYATAGATLGFATLWTSIVTFPLMVGIQVICARIGVTSGAGLAGALRRHYPRAILYPALLGLVFANTLNAGADIGAIAAGINLIVPIPIAALIIPIALGILALQLWGSYRVIAAVFKWLALTLTAYIAAAFFARPDWGEVLRGTFVPRLSLDRTYLLTLVAILGTTISPYLFFWESSEEAEEEAGKGHTPESSRGGELDAELTSAAWDTTIGMFFANLVFYFIILATAATLNATGSTDIQSAADAAAALRPVAGDAASILFALGMIGAGVLAVPVLTGAGAYAVAETFGWTEGLGQRPARAKAFYAVIVGSTLAGLAINFIGINPIKALVYVAAINGILAPPLLVLLLFVSNNRAVMGERVNGWGLNLLGWAAAALMSIAALALVVTWWTS